MTKIMTTAQVATRLDVSRRRVQQWIDSGQLAAHMFGRAYAVRESDVIAFSRIDRKSGRPKLLSSKKNLL